VDFEEQSGERAVSIDAASPAHDGDGDCRRASAVEKLAAASAGTVLVDDLAGDRG